MSFDWGSGARPTDYGRSGGIDVDVVFNDPRFSSAVQEAIKGASSMRSVFPHSSIDPRAIAPAGPLDIVGRVVHVLTDDEPDGWLIANGQAVTGKYPTLRSLLIGKGSPFGSASSGDPLLPDLRDKMAVGSGSTYALGDTGGAATVTLTEEQLPSHNHGPGTLATGSGGNHTHTVPTHQASDTVSGTANGLYNAATNLDITTTGTGAHSHSITTGVTGNTGSGSAHNNMPPYVALTPLVRAY